ncbi:hypothetical protein [Methylocystis parvus]
MTYSLALLISRAAALLFATGLTLFVVAFLVVAAIEPPRTRRRQLL